MGGGGGDCESCATWSEHYYWNHTSDDKKQFLVAASGDFRHSMVTPANRLPVFPFPLALFDSGLVCEPPPLIPMLLLEEKKDVL
jgi:hypothetical protein